MDLKEKVNELIDLFESACAKYCTTRNRESINDIGIISNLSFMYYKSIGVMMFESNIWYLDDKNVYATSEVKVPNLRKRLCELVAKDVVSIEQLESLTFSIS